MVLFCCRIPRTWLKPICISQFQKWGVKMKVFLHVRKTIVLSNLPCLIGCSIMCGANTALKKSVEFLAVWPISQICKVLGDVGKRSMGGFFGHICCISHMLYFNGSKNWSNKCRFCRFNFRKINYLASR